MPGLLDGSRLKLRKDSSERLVLRQPSKGSGASTVEGPLEEWRSRMRAILRLLDPPRDENHLSGRNAGHQTAGHFCLDKKLSPS